MSKKTLLVQRLTNLGVSHDVANSYQESLLAFGFDPDDPEVVEFFSDNFSREVESVVKESGDSDSLPEFIRFENISIAHPETIKPVYLSKFSSELHRRYGTTRVLVTECQGIEDIEIEACFEFCPPPERKDVEQIVQRLYQDICSLFTLCCVPAE